MVRESDLCVFCIPSQRFSVGLRSALCDGQSMCEKLCLMLPEPLLHNLRPMNCGTVILEYARAIREEKKSTDGKTKFFSIISSEVT